VDFTRQFVDSWEGTNHDVLVDDLTAEHVLENARARGNGGTRRSAEAPVG
jgi:hypothetical protein